MARIRHLRALLAALVVVLGALTGCDHYAAGDTRAPGLTPVPSPLGPTSSSVPLAAPCSVPDVPSDLVVAERVRTVGGACLPAGSALVYRCDPGLDPVATLDADGARQRFLGGRFAVPVEALPLGASTLGVTTLGRMSRVVGEPSALYVEAGDRIERWLALPAKDEVEDPPAALMIGDSIMDGAEEAIPLALPEWTLQLDAEVGRGSFGGVSIAESFVEPAPDVVVVELGVNDHDGDAFAANAERILAAFDEADLLVWVTAHGPDTDVDEVNDAIRQVMAGRTDGTIADWDAFVSPEDLNGDGVHPGSGNEALLSELLAPIVEDWWMAVHGFGPTRCGPEVESPG